MSENSEQTRELTRENAYTGYRAERTAQAHNQPGKAQKPRRGSTREQRGEGGERGT